MAAPKALAAVHTNSVLTCAVLPGPKLLVSGGEDGAICFTDLSSLRPAGRLAVPASVGEAVPSLCGHPGEEHTFFAAAGSCVLELDLRAGLGPAAVRRCFAANADEVNCVAVSAGNGGWLAAADDAGEVQVISLAPAAGAAGAAAAGDPSAASAAGGGAAAAAAAAEGSFPRPARPAAYKTLRRGHSNIAAAAAFRPHRPWELLSGGLDSTVVKWDFSRLRPLQSWNLGSEATASGGQLFNPPMVHCLAVPQTDDRALGRLMAVARGDGCVSLYDADWKPAASSSSSGGSSGRKGKGGASSKRGSAGSKQQQAAAGAAVPSGRLALLGREQGGHTAAVNCVTFFPGGRQLLSAGNDCRLLLWNLEAAQEQQAAAGAVAAEQQEQGDGGEQPSSDGGTLRQGAQQQAAAGAAAEQQPLLVAEHQHARKINWVCTADVPGCSFNVFIADTGRRLTALSLAP